VTDQPKSTAHDLKLTLLENSHSFLCEALTKAVAAEKESGQWKFAIFNLTQAIELSLKERLRREHPLLVFQDAGKQGQTVGLRDAVLRLRDDCQLPLSQDDVDTIKRAAAWRNQIVHSEFSLNTAELKAAFAKLTGFIADFHVQFLGDKLKETIPEKLWQEVVSIREYIEDILRRANDRLAREKIHPSTVWPCLKCGWKAFVSQHQKNKCYVCGHTDLIAECDGCGRLEYVSQMRIEPDPEPGSYDFDHLCRECLGSPDYWNS
jgi:hypothetical protein